MFPAGRVISGGRARVRSSIVHTATLHQRPAEDTGDGNQAKTIARYSVCWTPRSSSAFERGSVSDGQSGGLGDGCGLQKVLQTVFRRSARWFSEGPPDGLQKVRQEVL